MLDYKTSFVNNSYLLSVKLILILLPNDISYWI